MTHPTHDLWLNHHRDAPSHLRDHNGKLFLDQCRICGRAVRLDEPCTGAAVAPKPKRRGRWMARRA